MFVCLVGCQRSGLLLRVLARTILEEKKSITMSFYHGLIKIRRKLYFLSFGNQDLFPRCKELGPYKSVGLQTLINLFVSCVVRLTPHTHQKR